METQDFSHLRNTTIINPQELPAINQKPCRSVVVRKLSKSEHFWRQTVKSILDAIQKSDSNKNLMSSQFWKYQFTKVQNYHLNKHEKLQFLQILSELIKVNYGESRVDDQIEFCGKLGAKFLKLENTLHFKHKQSLEYFKFMANEKYHGEQLNQLLFSKLKFDLSQKETLDVAAVVRVFCQNDLAAFVFLSLYLQISVLKKLTTGQISMVEKQYKARLTTLEEQYPVAKYQSAQSSSNQNLQLTRMIIIKPKYQSSEFHFAKNNKSHFEQLKRHIITKAEYAKKDYRLFEKLVKGICSQKGYGFKSGLKIKSSSNTASIFRTIEKLLEDKVEKLPDIISWYNIVTQIMESSTQKKVEFYENYQKNKSVSTKQDSKKTNFQKYLKTLIDEEKKRVDLKIQQILDQEKYIKFQVKDLLRGKCTFDRIQDIIETGKLLIKQIQEKGHQVLEVKNKLNEKTKDFVLIIRLPNSIAELQLVLKLDSVSNEFNHKIYELNRSKLYSPITNLHVHNEKWGQRFFTQQIQMIKDIVKITEAILVKDQKIKDYKIKDFKEDVQVFRETYLQQYEIPCNKDQQQRVQQNNLIGIETLFLIRIIQQNKYTNIDWEKRKRNRKCHEVKFLIKNMNYMKGLESLNQISIYQLQNDIKLLILKGDILYQKHSYQECMACYVKCVKFYEKNERVTDEKEQKITKVNKKIGSVYNNKGDYPKALEYYERCLQIEIKINGKYSNDVVTTLNGIGSVYCNKGDYPKALEYYERCLQIETKIKGKYSNDVATTLNNIGSVYKNEQYYPQALEYYERCLSIKTKIKGKDSIDVATTLNNIGSVYWNKADYLKALEYYERSLQIKTKIKGKYSIDVATTLNNIGLVYCNEGDYFKALEYYKRSLSIKTKIKGKDSIDVATTLNNIGSIYWNKGVYPKALEYYEHCLQIETKIKGKDSIDVATTLNNISFVYQEMGDIVKTKKFKKMSKDIKSKIND